METLKLLVLLLINLIASGKSTEGSGIADALDTSRDANTSMTLGELWAYFTTWSGITTGFIAFWAVIYVKVFIIWVLWSWFFFGLFNGRNGGPYGSGYGKPQYATYTSRNLELNDKTQYLSRMLEVLSPKTGRFN